MAKSNFKKIGGIKDTEGGNFGNYDEYNGGGSPKGGVWGGKSGRVGWSQREKDGEVAQGEKRQAQPRTNDGKFTYNSVNGKETEYESRGKTVNPLLTGGKNGVKISDVRQQFAAKSGNLYDQYKDKWYQAGSELIVKEGRKYKVKLAKNDVWEIARTSFDIKSGGFAHEAGNFDEGKKGRHSKQELAAMAEARANKGEQFVKGGQGEIAQKKGAAAGQQLTTGKKFVVPYNRINAFRRMQQAALTGSQINPTPVQVPEQHLTLAHSPEQIQAVKNALTRAGVDVSKFTDQQISGILSRRNKK